MTDAEEPQEPAERPGVDFAVGLADLESIDLNAALHDTNSVDCDDINELLTNLDPQRPAQQLAAIQLLAAMTNYHFDAGHRTEPFKPRWIMDGRRSLVPADLREEQINVIAEFAANIENPGLRARLADVAWFMQRRRHEMAEVAINAYCEAVEGVRSGDSQFAHDDHSAWGVNAKEALARAASISHATRWKLPASERLKALVSDLIRTAHGEGQSDDFWRIAEVDLDHSITPPAEVAAAAEHLAGKLGDAPEARLRLLGLAARAHQRNRDEVNSNRCLIEVAQCHIQKSELADSPMVEAAFLQTAIQVLRGLPDTKDFREELSARLRAVQPRIRDEMGQFSTEIDLTKIVEHSAASVQGHSCPTAFLGLIFCDRPPAPDEIRDRVQKSAGEHPLQAIMPVQVHDLQGRVVFRSPGMGDGERPGDQLRYLMAVDRGHHRRVVVAGAIRPIRQIISEEHPVPSDVIVELLRASPFIPDGHEYIYARAISHFLAGADVEAVSLLVPQLENSLRHLLALNGHDTTTADEEGVQTEASLSILLNPARPWRTILEEIIPARYVHEIDLLFDFPGGPAVRNQVAHGKVPAGGFWDEDFIYAAWLVIHLAVLPMVKRWEEVERTFARATGLHRSPDSPESDEGPDPPR